LHDTPRPDNGSGVSNRPARPEPRASKPPGVEKREALTAPRDAAGERLDRWLAAALSLPLPQARALITAGRARIRGKTCAITRKLFGGEVIEVDRPAPRAEAATGPALAALHDDADVLVVDKPPGLPVEPAVPGAPSVVGAASRLGAFDVEGRARPGLAHRLDRDTSGALLLARHDRALAALKRAFEEGRVEKEYLVLAAGAPPDEARLDTPYARSPADARRYTTKIASARRARLSFRVERRLAGAALLRVVLETGRTHQIRVQLAEAGWPVLGDAVYGVASPAIARQALHAERLVFPLPADGTRVEVRAPIPADLEQAIAALTE
jgi:23S rRNA pseudouridine1911/1915/1917 synthase